MKVETWPITRVVPYGRNPRKNAAAMPGVVRSLKAFKFRQPIVVDAEGVIVVGHTRWAAAKQLGMTEVPVHVASDLTPAEVKAYRLADNKSNEAANWDAELLALELGDLKSTEVDLALTGFDDGELAALFSRTGVLSATDVDDVPALPKTPVTKLGDLITLGQHRLLCGDSTKAEDVARLMAGEHAGLLWTDPPYGVSYFGKTADALEMANDDADGLLALLTAALTAVGPSLVPGAPFYIAHPAGARSLDFAAAIAAAGWQIHQTLVWVKDSMVLGHSDYHYRHEPILYGYLPGPGRSGRGKHEGTRWFGGNAETSVFEIPRPKASPDHPTGKPVELVARHVGNSSQADDIVLEPFAGSGTTLIACERLRRRCRAMELEPAYCDVIVTRWEKVTGLKATRPRPTTTKRTPARAR
jgi:site-specific DNA-methyltransferase (adenine-specific)